MTIKSILILSSDNDVETGNDVIDDLLPMEKDRTKTSLCYVMWNLFTADSLLFPNDSSIASLEANQNRKNNSHQKLKTTQVIDGLVFLNLSDKISTKEKNVKYFNQKNV